jgi:hypothetical protein
MHVPDISRRFGLLLEVCFVCESTFRLMIIIGVGIFERSDENIDFIAKTNVVDSRIDRRSNAHQTFER